MKYLKILTLVLIVTFFAGYIFAQNITREAGVKKTATDLDMNIGDIGGCSNPASSVNTNVAPKLKSILESDAESGYRSTHGILGLFRLGLLSGKMGNELCEDTASGGESCNVIRSIGSVLGTGARGNTEAGNAEDSGAEGGSEDAPATRSN